MVRHLFMRWIGLSLLALLMTSCSGLAGEPVIVATLPPSTQSVAQVISLPQSAPDLTAGAQIYAANCTRCHGITGKADGEMVLSGQVTGVPDFTDPQISQDAAPIDWFEVVTNGRLDKLMPPWADKLSESQRWDVTMYVYTLANTPEKIAQGKTVWTAQCTDCHGQAGEGTTKGAPLPNLLKSTTTQLLTTLDNGIPDKMHDFADKLSADDSAAVIAYARILSLTNTNPPAEIASAPTAAAAANTNQQPAVTQDANANSQPATTADANAVNAIGIVGGKVINMTSGGTVPTDLALSLYVVSGQNSQAPQQVLDTKIKPDGTYQFENVPIGADQHYVVMASYKDTVFTSDMVAGDPANPKVDLPVSIYEVADNAASIKISEMVTMMQVNPTTNQLQVVQIISFTNDSDRAYLKSVDGSPTSTSIKLPKGAAFQDFSGGKYRLSADGTQVFDTEAVMPGSPHLMHLGYTLPYSGQMSIDQSVDYALNGKVQVMVANKGLTITGDQFAALGSSQLGSQTYQSFGGEFTRAAGDSLRYDLTGSLAATTTAATAATVNIISPLAYVLIAIGLVAIGTAIGFFMRERTDQRANPQSQTNDLMKQIADLDVRHNEGKIGEAQYLKQRSALKAQLVALMKDKSKSGGITSD